MHPPYTLTLPNHPHPLHIRSFTLTEALNQAPQLVVEAESDNAWEPCVGHTALFSLHAVSSDAIRAQIVEALRRFSALSCSFTVLAQYGLFLPTAPYFCRSDSLSSDAFFSFRCA